MNLAQEGAHIGHQAERDRIVAADFLGVDVDVNEPRRRNGEGIAGDPRTRGAVVEAHAERQQHVGLARGVVGLVVAGARDQTERERMIGSRSRRGRWPRPPPESAGARRASAVRRRRRHSARPGRPASPAARRTSSMSTALTTPSGSAPQRLEILPFQAFAFGASSAADSMKHVEGNVEHHRARTARGHRLPGLPDRERHHLAARRLEHLLAIGRARWRESRPDNAGTVPGTRRG